MSSDPRDPASGVVVHPLPENATATVRGWQTYAIRLAGSFWVRFFPFLRWFPIESAVLRADLIAGIIGALVLVPKAMAYAQLSGLPVYFGLYAAFIPAILGALWGSSRQLLTGPVAVISLMTGAALAPLALAGTDQYIALALLLALLVGVIQIGMGVFKLGMIVNFISHPVIIGFINAAAIIIALSQLNKLLGIPLGRSDSFLYDIGAMLLQIGDTHLPTLAMGVLAFAIMWGMKKYTSENIARTSVLVAVAVTILISWAFGFEHNMTNRIEQVADTNARVLLSNLSRVEQRIGELNAQITEKSAQLRALQKSKQGHTRSALALEYDINLLRLELTNKEQEDIKHLRAIRGLTFEYVPTSTDRDGVLYLSGQVPAGQETDGYRYHVKKVSGQHLKLVGGGEVAGQIPSGLPSLSIPRLSWDSIVQLISAAFVIALVAFMESISMAKAIATRTKQRVDANQELIGQGLANVGGSFFQSYPVTGSFSGSAINLQAGAKTGFASVFNGLFVGLTLLLLTAYLYHLPQAVLSVIIILAVGSLLHVNSIKRAWQANRQDGIVAVTTFILTLVFAPHLDKGVLSGAVLALILYLYRTMQPRVAVLARHPDGTLRDAETYRLRTCDEIALIRFDGELYFANTSYFEDKIMERVALKSGLRYVIVVGDGINNVDASSEEMLAHLTERLHAAGIVVLFAGLKKQVIDVFIRTGLYKEIGETRFFRTVEQALDHAWKQLGGNHEVDCPLNIVCPIQPANH